MVVIQTESRYQLSQQPMVERAEPVLRWKSVMERPSCATRCPSGGEHALYRGWSGWFCECVDFVAETGVV